MGMFKLASSGSWWMTSEIDPRWNVSGDTDFCGGFEEPSECKQARERLQEKYGNPPSDLRWHYMKD